MRILVADDHELFREGLRHILGQLEEGVVVIEARDFDEAVCAAEREPAIDVVLLDLNMPGGPWSDGLQRLRSILGDEARIVILSATDDQHLVRQAVSLGAAGFIPKTASSRVMLSALNLILSGGVYLPPAMLEQALQSGHAPATNDGANFLTPRQRDVLTLLVQGKSNKEIARVLDLAEGTVKLHVTAILKSLNVNNRTRAVVAAAQLGLAPSM
jgi:DNA-binding NarL/FixJ family response regulator